MTPQEVNKALAGRFMQALDCLEAVERAGLSPSALAADPECIKRLVESASAYLRLPIGSYASGDSLKAMVAALAAIGKEPA